MPSAPFVEIDLGEPSSQHDPMADFEERTSHLEQEISTLEHDLRKLSHLLSLPKTTASASTHATAIEARITTTRSALASLAEDNKRAAKSADLGPASLRIRVTRFAKLTADFTAFLQRFETARDRFREQLGQALADDVHGLGLGASKGEVDDAVREGQLERVLQKASPELRFQVEELRERNKAFAKLNRDVVQLHEMFVELSLLTEKQQTLINDIEHNVEQVQHDVEKADEEIIEARRHQKSANKKKLMIAAIIAIILIIVIVVLIVQLT